MTGAGVGRTLPHRLTTVLGALAVLMAAGVVLRPAVFNVAFGLALVCFTALAVTRPRVLRAASDPLVLAPLGIAAWALISMAWTRAPLPGALDALDDFRVFLVPLLLLPALCEPIWRRRVVLVLVAMLTLTLVLSLLDPVLKPAFTHAGRAALAEGEGGVRGAVWHDRIRHSVHIAWLMLFAWAIVRSETRPAWRWVAVAVGIAAAFDAAVLVQSRTGFLLVGVLSAFALLQGRSVRRGALVAASVFAVVAAAALISGQWLPERIASLTVELGGYLRGERIADTDAGVRLQLWRTAAHAFIDAPFLGQGIGAFQEVVRIDRAAQGLTAWEHRDPHNEFLDVAVALGMPGLLAWVYVLVTVWLRAASRDPLEALLTRGSVIAYVTAALVNGVMTAAGTAYFFGMLLALAVGASASSRAHARER